MLDKSTFVTYNGKKHNHLPPKNPQILKKVKDKALSLMRVGVTPAVVHKELVNEAPFPSSVYVSSQGQLHTWKYQDAMNNAPSGTNKQLSTVVVIVIC
jgi:hypothetical protein